MIFARSTPRHVMTKWKIPQYMSYLTARRIEWGRQQYLPRSVDFPADRMIQPISSQFPSHSYYFVLDYCERNNPAQRRGRIIHSASQPLHYHRHFPSILYPVPVIITHYPASQNDSFGCWIKELMHHKCPCVKGHERYLSVHEEHRARPLTQSTASF